ncbi:cell division protein FtsA [Candidatus Kuenenbacteria bacterium HGW-Kuenenbacteria-1]|uniref:Cell division protein FtsA n=1 Tax=Candidatus Kuenenbacteria bacterium HGW-Kuenenbacteria-1 TaxID=2013812 RepID=A0A2N1UNW8_9BACT|nr:MAG: cell division protein FtsA [Candidatus Kuenenbacteria bacterium HGW-Kuenenbacteria-1]
MQQKIITGIDIGSSSIRIVIGQFDINEQIQIICAIEGPNNGMNRGVITNIEDAVSSISSVLEKTERITGTPIEHAFVGISGSHIISQPSHGVVAIAKANGEVEENDIERVINAAQTVITPPNYEILHIIPQTFTIDRQTGIKDPIGMSGIRLEVDAQIIEGLSSPIKNLTKCINRTGINVNDLVFSILATSEAVLNKRQKELGVAVINLGGATTSFIIFEEGDLITCGVLPIGSDHITSDIAIGLRISIDLAEKIKLTYGTALPDQFKKEEKINLNEFDDNEKEAVSKKYIANIIEARVEEIFRMINAEFKKINRDGKLPAGVILTGGGAKLPGIVELAKKEFRLPASIDTSQENIFTSVDKINDPEFSTALGLVLWGSQAQQKHNKFSFSNLLNIKQMVSSIKKWIKSFGN